MSARSWLTRVSVAATAAGIGLVASGAVLSPASADAPVKVGWWNAAAAGGAAAPGPDANAGGMRVAVSPQKLLSYGAVAYDVAKDATATIELPVTFTSNAPNAPAPAPPTSNLTAIQACPTKDNAWKAGDDQDAATGPQWDCSSYHFVGALSADGKTMTFLVDGAADVVPGTLSLAIVPVPSTSIPVAGTDAGTDTTAPFVIDFDKPPATSLTVSGGSTAVSGPPPAAAPPPPPPATTTGGAPSTAGGAASISVPPATTTDAGQTPVVAGSAPTTLQPATVPAAASRPASANDNKRNLLLVLLILILFGILYTQNVAQRAPRALAGPRARAATDEVPVVLSGFAASRGLGRFAKARTERPRPLI